MLEGGEAPDVRLKGIPKEFPPIQWDIQGGLGICFPHLIELHQIVGGCTLYAPLGVTRGSGLCVAHEHGMKKPPLLGSGGFPSSLQTRGERTLVL
jgi:hypothetical protein